MHQSEVVESVNSGGTTPLCFVISDVLQHIGLNDDQNSLTLASYPDLNGISHEVQTDLPHKTGRRVTDVLIGGTVSPRVRVGVSLCLENHSQKVLHKVHVYKTQTCCLRRPCEHVV